MSRNKIKRENAILENQSYIYSYGVRTTKVRCTFDTSFWQRYEHFQFIAKTWFGIEMNLVKEKVMKAVFFYSWKFFSSFPFSHTNMKEYLTTRLGSGLKYYKKCYSNLNDKFGLKKTNVPISKTRSSDPLLTTGLNWSHNYNIILERIRQWFPTD